MVVLPDVLKGSEFRFRDPSAVLGQLEDFIHILLEDAKVLLAENPLFSCFQQVSVVAGSANRLVVTLCHVFLLVSLSGMVENIGIKLHFVNRFYSLGVEVVLQEWR